MDEDNGFVEEELRATERFHSKNKKKKKSFLGLGVLFFLSFSISAIKSTPSLLHSHMLALLCMP